MTQSSLRFLTAVLFWTANLLGVSHPQIYTSTSKIQDMIEQEEQTLNNMYAAVYNLGNETASTCFLKFYHARLPQVKELQKNQNLEESLKHPNTIYHVIKQFATEYANLRSALGSVPPEVQKHLSLIADMRDLLGSRLSFLRLQTVYNLSASDMVKGDYFGYRGPELSDMDALAIGEVAFKEGRINHAIDWFYEALARTKREPSAGFVSPGQTADISDRIYALLARCYRIKGNHEKAQEMYRQVYISDLTASQASKLEQELESKPQLIEQDDDNANLSKLCSLQNKLTQNKFDRRLACSYKKVILPYYRFKMELLSISPYVALFYEVISDFESQTVINAARGNLQRGRVETYDGQSITQEGRTSDLSFIDDDQSPVIAGMSKRVEAITNLLTKPYVEGSDYFSEPFQVVNYGMGGHYTMHLDTFAQSSLEHPNNKRYSTHGGNRLATFLLYLTEVERGGSTVFTRADLAVAPVKRMALFWYSFNPSGEIEDSTLHAGCPVVYGHKWVSNKWIWQKGNTFTRRCSLKLDATQLDIDKYMRRGWA